MSEHNRSCRRHEQAQKMIEEELARGPNNRGVYLQGLWSCRMAAGLTQRELAKMAGTCQSAIQALENQQRAAYPKTLRRLCKALEVEPLDLIAQKRTTEI